VTTPECRREATGSLLAIETIVGSALVILDDNDDDDAD